MILLDTNVVSAVMASKPSLAVLAWLDAQDTDHLFLSTITIAEIGYGLRILPEGQRRKGTVSSRSRVIRRKRGWGIGWNRAVGAPIVPVGAGVRPAVG